MTAPTATPTERTDGRRVLLRLRHGSHLYGTARPDSDEDWYQVVSGLPSGRPGTTRYGYSRQSIQGDQDLVTKDLGTWLREVQAGVPQACEAAWAPDWAVETDEIRELRLSLRHGTGGIVRHRRAMRNFASGYWDGGWNNRGPEARVEYAAKRSRHAVRLALKIRDLREFGWYSPVLTAEEWRTCQAVAANHGNGEELYQTVNWISMT